MTDQPSAALGLELQTPSGPSEQREKWRAAKAAWRSKNGRENESPEAHKRRLASVRAKRKTAEYRAYDAAYRRRRRREKRGVGYHSTAGNGDVPGASRG